MKKLTKTEKIREGLRAGKTAKQIAAEAKVPVASVYTLRWKLKNKKLKYPRMKTVTISAVDRTDKVDGVRASKMIAGTPNIRFLRDELSTVQKQIADLSVVASFIAIRLRQLEQNDE